MNSEAPAICIGLPVYNGERFLERAITSVIDQTETDWHLVITDNGSTDRTQEIASAFAQRDDRITYRRNPENLGAVANFAIAFESCASPYFAWLAYDDWYAPEYLSRMKSVLDADAAAVMCFSGMGVVDDSGEVFRSRTEPIDAAKSQTLLVRVHTVLWSLGDPTAPVFGLMRSNALRRTGLIRNSNEPDRILITELAALGPIYQVHEQLFLHYGPRGHTVRDNWAWLNPANRGKPRLATFRIFSHQLNAIRRADGRLVERYLLIADLVLATIVTRVRGKTKSIIRSATRSVRS